MPVKAFIGLQRNGKSYSCMKYAVLPQLRTGRKVVTNIAVTQKALDEFPNLEYQKKIDYKNLQAGAFYAIDEMWTDCPKGTTTLKLDHDFKEFFAMSGHLVGDNDLTTEIIIITQNFETQLCDYVLGQIERTYYVEKIALSNNKNMCNTTEYKGIVKGNPPKGKSEGTKSEAFDPEVFEYYKSNSGAKDGQVAIEMDVIKKKTLMDLKIIKYGLPIGAVVIIFLIYMGIKVFGTWGGKKEIKNTKPIKENTSIVKRASKLTPSNKPSSYNTKIDKKRAKNIEKFYSFTDEVTVFPMSEDKRLTGKITLNLPPKIIKDYWELTIRNQHTVEIASSHVKKDIYGQYYMVYRGEIVTQYTGENPFIYDDKYIPDGRSAESKENGTVANIEPVKNSQEQKLLGN